MSNLKGNLIFGAVLATGLGIMGVRVLTGILYNVEPPTTPGYAVEVAVEETASGATAVATVIPDWGTIIPTTDIASGEAVFKKCASCHSIEKSGANKTGPALWGIMGSKPGVHGVGFNYSAAMKEYGAANVWDFDTLYKFLENPKGVIKGTAMSYAGLKKSEDRVALIAYLHAKADSPIAVPAPKPAAPPAEAAPAAADAPAAPAAPAPAAAP